ncbi:MAG TPA: histidine phosphatase family protein [Planctomycetaceae bacterium]|nr:histidine phosphatase family protein [Planctomycetaceae bacterium]
MTRRLLVMRHAKSSWSDPTLADHDRPLNARGKRDALRAGQWLLERRTVPDLIFTSTAKRARKTAKRVARALGSAAPDIVTIRELYHADPETYASWAASAPGHVETLLVIGHNPGMAFWVAQLASEIDAFPTAAIACVTLAIDDWSEMTVGTRGDLEWFWYPKLESHEGKHHER